MADNSLVITVNMVGGAGVAAAAAKIAASIKGMTATVNGANVGVVNGTKQLTEYEKAQRVLGKTLSDTNKKMLDWSTSLDQKVMSGVKNATLGVIGLAAAVTALGVAAANQYQSTTLSVQGFTGGTYAKSAKETAYLQSLTNPLKLGEVTGGFQQLKSTGDSDQTVNKLLKNFADISAVTQDKSGTFNTLSDVYAQVKDSGRLDPRSIKKLQLSGIDLTGMIADEMGVPRNSITKWLTSGAPMFVPKFGDDMLNMAGMLQPMIGGRDRYTNQTLAGGWGEIKKQIGIAMAGQLVNGQQTGPGDQLARFMSGTVAPGVGNFITTAAPKVEEFIGKLAKDLPPLGTALEHLGTAAAPLIPMFESVSLAIIPIVTTLTKDMAALVKSLLKSPLVHFLETVVTEGAKLGPVRTAVADFLELLIGFKAISTVASGVKGLLTTIEALQTRFGGAVQGPVLPGGATPVAAGSGLFMNSLVVASAAIAVTDAVVTINNERHSVQKAAKSVEAKIKADADPNLLANWGITKQHTLGFWGTMTAKLSGVATPHEMVRDEIFKRAKAGDASFNELIFGKGSPFNTSQQKEVFRAELQKGTATIPNINVVVNNHQPITDANVVAGTVHKATRDALDAYARDRAARGSGRAR